MREGGREKGLFHSKVKPICRQQLCWLSEEESDLNSKTIAGEDMSFFIQHKNRQLYTYTQVYTHTYTDTPATGNENLFKHEGLD